MINDGINNVPDKTIAVFTDPFKHNFESKERNRLYNIIDKPSKKRDWFGPHFYRCLPLVIGNQYGFIIKSEFDFSFIWNGESNVDAISFEFDENKGDVTRLHPRIESHFGDGIITIDPPFTLRTPPGVNLMTINPPNYIIPNVTVMSGVVEADNIRRNFTINLKIQIPHIKVHLPAGTPLAAIIPIPRYDADQFELKYAEDIFNEETINEETEVNIDTLISRELVEPTLTYGVGRNYFKGEDVYGNKFPDHQKP
jgi:hypothetical protein